MRFQVMRSKALPKAAEASGVKFRDMYMIVCDILVKTQSPGRITVFKLDEKEIFDNLVEQIRRDCPNLVNKIDGV